MNNIKFDKIVYFDSDNVKLTFVPIIKNNNIMFIFNDILLDKERLQYEIEKSGKEYKNWYITMLKAYKLESINDNIVQYDCILPIYSVNSYKKRRINIRQILFKINNLLWNKNLNDIKSSNPRIQTVYSVIDLHKNTRKKSGKYSNKYLVVKINGIELDFPYETSYRAISGFVSGSKKRISMSHNLNTVEFVTQNKRNSFKKITKNKYLVYRYKDIIINDKNIIIGIDNIRSFQKSNGEYVIPQAEKILNPKYKSQVEKHEENINNLKYKLIKKYPNEYHEEFKLSEPTYDQLLQFKKKHVRINNGLIYEKDVYESVSKLLGNNYTVQHTGKNPYLSDIKINNFYIETKLNYSSAPLIHMTVEVQDKIQIKGKSRMAKTKNKKYEMDKLEELLNENILSLLKKDNNYQTFLNNYKNNYINLTDNNILQLYNKEINKYKNDIKIFSNIAKLNNIQRSKYFKNNFYDNNIINFLKTHDTIKYIELINDKSFEKFSIEDKKLFYYLRYISTSPLEVMSQLFVDDKKISTVFTRRIAKVHVYDKMTINQVMNFINYYYYNVNDIKYVEIQGDTYIINNHDDPLGLQNNYNIPNMEESVNEIIIYLNLSRNLKNKKLQIYIRSNNKNHTSFTDQFPKNIQIQKVNI